MGFGIDDLTNAVGDLGEAGASLLAGDVAGARNHLSDADSAITGDTSNENASVALGSRQDATMAAARQARSDEQRQEQLGSHLDGGSDGQSVASFENYAAFDHPELYAKAQEMSSSGSQNAAKGWTDLGISLGGHFETLGQTLSSAITNGWEGDGASAAATTSARYVRQASALQPAFSLTGLKLQEAACAAGATNAAVPPPVEFNRTHAVLHGVVSVLTGGAADADVKAQQGAMDAAHAEAVQVMVSTYKPMMVSADSGVPTFAAPSSPTTGDLASTQLPDPGNPRSPGSAPWFPQTRPGGGPTGGGPNGGSTYGPAGSQPRAGQIAPTGTPTAGSGGPGYGTGSGGHGEPAAAVSSAGYSAPGYGGGSGFGGAGQGVGAGAGYSSGGYGGAGGAAGYGAGGAAGFGARGGTAGSGGAGGSAGSRGFGGSGGYGSGGSASGGSGSGSAGSAGSSGLRGGGTLGGGTGATGAGTGVGAAGEAAGATGAGPGSGSSGAAGSGGARSGVAGGMGGGRGGRGEEDYEHNTPSYLITDDNGSEIVGTLPPVAPAVIGE